MTSCFLDCRHQILIGIYTKYLLLREVLSEDSHYLACIGSIYCHMSVSLWKNGTSLPTRICVLGGVRMRAVSIAMTD